MATTARLALPYPVPADTADVPRDMQALANKLDPSATIFLQGTLAARPAFGTQGRLFYASDTGVVYYDTGTAWVSVGPSPVTRPPLLSALPSSPADGDEIYFLADDANGIVWHLRYRAASTQYKWEMVGGPPMWAFVGTAENVASASYVDMATPGPQIIAPLPGTYRIGMACYMQQGTGANTQGYMAPKLGTGTASDGNLMFRSGAATALTLLAQGGNFRFFEITDALRTIKAQYKSNNVMTISHRSMELLPLRVGV